MRKMGLLAKVYSFRVLRSAFLRTAHLVQEKQQDSAWYWLDRILFQTNFLKCCYHLIFLSTHSAQHEEHEVAFVQYLHLTSQMKKKHRILNCISLKWATDNEVDHSVYFKFSSSGTMEAEEWYEVVPV